MTTTRTLARLSGYAALWCLLIAASWVLIVPAFLAGIAAGVVYEICKRRAARRSEAATNDLMAIADAVQDAPVFDLDEIRRLRAIAQADAEAVRR